MSRPSIVDPSTDWLTPAAAVVREGGLVALPFERLFGLAADAADPRAVERVVIAKGRGRGSGGRPIAVVLPELGAIDLVVSRFTPLAARLAERYWPGPLTLLLPAAAGLAPALIGPDGLIGVRLPGPCPAAELARVVGRPLTATSANRAGAPDALRHEDVAALDGVDLVLAGAVPGPPGSTVVDATGERPLVVRSGVIELVEAP